MKSVATLRLFRFVICAAAALTAATSPIFAGMPAPIPSDPMTYLSFSDSALLRVQSISLFAIVFVVSCFVFQRLWNYLQRSFTSLPKLSFGAAVSAVLLWGALFVVVLTMISGARELMTPGAWQKQGFTYKIAPSESTSAVSPEKRRRAQLEALRTALWQYAANHQGAFPAEADMSAISADLWEVPDAGGLRYRWIPGLKASPEAGLLAYEPELDRRSRLVLRTNGDIVEMSSQQIADALKRGKSE